MRKIADDLVVALPSNKGIGVADIAQPWVWPTSKRSLIALFVIAVLALALLVIWNDTTRVSPKPRREIGWQPIAGDHWAAVTRLAGGFSDEYFVVIDVHYLTNTVAIEDAARVLCKSANCDIGFFADREDVPAETAAVDFSTNGGWADSGEIAHYFQDVTTRGREIKFDCDVVQQLFLNYCLKPPHPTLAQNAFIATRHPLRGFGRAKFGMSLTQLKFALDQQRRFWILQPASPLSISIVQTADRIGHLHFNSFYNVINGRLGSIALVASEKLNNVECFQSEQQIAAWLDQHYGKHDQFEYYDESLTSNEFLWRFPNWAQISLNNLAPKGGGCVLRVTFEDLPSE
jgi:hypothetical protein